MCRGPKRAPVRTYRDQPNVAVPVHEGCPCSLSGGASIGTVAMDIQWAGDPDAPIIRYEPFEFDANGHPVFMLDYQVLDTIGLYSAVIKSFQANIIREGGLPDGERTIEIIPQVCGVFPLYIGRSCSMGDPYVSSASPQAGGNSYIIEGCPDCYDMQPSVCA